MANLQMLKDELSKLTVLEAAELSKILEEAWACRPPPRWRLRRRPAPLRRPPEESSQSHRHRVRWRRCHQKQVVDYDGFCSRRPRTWSRRCKTAARKASSNTVLRSEARVQYQGALSSRRRRAAGVRCCSPRVCG